MGIYSFRVDDLVFIYRWRLSGKFPASTPNKNLHTNPYLVTASVENKVVVV